MRVFVAGANLGSLIGPPVLAVVVAWAGGRGDARWFLLAMVAAGLVLAPRGTRRRLASSAAEPVTGTAAGWFRHCGYRPSDQPF